MEALRSGHLDATQLVDRFANSFDGSLDGMLSLVQCRGIELGAVIMTSTPLVFLPQYCISFAEEFDHNTPRIDHQTFTETFPNWGVKPHSTPAFMLQKLLFSCRIESSDRIVNLSIVTW